MFRRSLLVCCAISAIAVPVQAFADVDAGAAPDAVSDVAAEDAQVSQPSDATAVGADVQQPPADVQQPPADAGAAGDANMSVSGYAAGACWDKACPKEVSTCLNDKNCAKLNGCLVAKDQACVDGFKGDKATLDLFNAAYNCGGAACIGSCSAKVCADNTKGKLPDGTDGKCYCDDACAGQKVPDCCADKQTFCPAAPPSNDGSCSASDCADNAQGQNADGSAAKCYCDAACKSQKVPDCCKDYDATCGKSGGNGDTGGTSKDAGGVCTPNCTTKAGDKKACGSDGCGKMCGVCAGDAFCNETTGKCMGGTSTPDAGSGADDAGALAVSDVAADSGTKAAAAGSAAPAKSGCTTSTNGSNSMTLLGLMALGFAGVIWRKRRA